MRGELDLCVPCSVKLGEAYDVRKIAGGVDHKVKCAECGRRRYGGTYQVGAKKKRCASEKADV